MTLDSARMFFCTFSGVLGLHALLSSSWSSVLLLSHGISSSKDDSCIKLIFKHLASFCDRTGSAMSCVCALPDSFSVTSSLVICSSANSSPACAASLRASVRPLGIERAGTWSSSKWPSSESDETASTCWFGLLRKQSLAWVLRSTFGGRRGTGCVKDNSGSAEIIGGFTSED